uniref:Uncharacterized protein n=1 Tax=Panagrolaimus sp. ES5 TaxID=591445 RepID=A0AC34G425_9BILA
MKLLIFVCLFLVVELSHEIPINKNDRKVLPLPTKDRKGDKVFENLGIVNPRIKTDEDETLLDQEPRHYFNDKSVSLTDEELVDLIVGEATADITDSDRLAPETSDSDTLSQRQKRGWFKKLWRSVEKRFKEVLPVAVVAGLAG